MNRIEIFELAVEFAQKKFNIKSDCLVYEHSFNDFGCCAWTDDLNAIVILINKDVNVAFAVETVMHEMVHAMQIDKGDMVADEEYIQWHGFKFLRSAIPAFNSKNIEDYMKLPWEIEPYKMSKLLFDEFIDSLTVRQLSAFYKLCANEGIIFEDEENVVAA